MQTIIDTASIIMFISGFFTILSLIGFAYFVTHGLIKKYQEFIHMRRLMREKHYFQKLMMKKLTNSY